MAADHVQLDYGQYVQAWRARLAQREAARLARVQQLRQLAHACAERLVERFGARSVYLFGSLVDGAWAHDRSDIDLAVEGLPGERYFEALIDLEELLLPGVEVDLLPLERAHRELAQQVRAHGVVLYGAA